VKPIVIPNQVSTGELRQFVDIHDFTFRDRMGLVTTFGKHREYLRWWIKGLSPHFPEQCRRVLMINAGSLLSAAWFPAKHLLSERTRRKVRLVGPLETYKALCNEADLASLPPFLGGHLKGDMMSSNEEVEHRFFHKGKADDSEGCHSLHSEKNTRTPFLTTNQDDAWQFATVQTESKYGIANPILTCFFLGDCAGQNTPPLSARTVVTSQAPQQQTSFATTWVATSSPPGDLAPFIASSRRRASSVCSETSLFVGPGVGIV
jgi:hypothetical protein